MRFNFKKKKKLKITVNSVDKVPILSIEHIINQLINTPNQNIILVVTF